MHVLLALLFAFGSVASTDHDTISVLPVRPASAADVKIAFGTVLKMTTSTRGLLETTLTIREHGGQTHEYLWANVTSVNDRAITCFQSGRGAWVSLCSAQQVGITPGKTSVAVLYWP